MINNMENSPYKSYTRDELEAELVAIKHQLRSDQSERTQVLDDMIENYKQNFNPTFYLLAEVVKGTTLFAFVVGLFWLIGLASK